MKKFAVAVVLLLSCTNPERARATLEKAGYSNIEITGHRFGCSKGDSTCTGFVARGPTGVPVEGVVGCGYSTGCSKGCTIRID